jgi:hypothetical protein
VQRLLGANAVAVRQQYRLRIDVQARRVEERAQVIEDVVALDLERACRDGAGVGVEVAQILVVGDERLVLVVEHDLERDVRVVRIDLGKGRPATCSRSCARRPRASPGRSTFSVASLYGGFHSIFW